MSEKEVASDDLYAKSAPKGEGQNLSLYIPNRIISALEARLASQGSTITWRVLALRLAKKAIVEEAERPS